MRAFDFFCGAGGLTRGLSDAGIEVIAGFDADRGCRITYERNNPRARFFAMDIRAVERGALERLARSDSFRDILFAGCAPCQSFSKHYRKSSRGTDATLLGQFGRLIGTARPGYVLVENVPGVEKVPGFSTFRRFLRLLEAAGYSYAFGVLDAKRFGVPQNRRRLVLLAALEGRAVLPDPKYGGTLRPFRTVRDAISHFPPLKAGESHPAIPNHVAARLSGLNLLRLRHTRLDGGDRRSWPRHLRLPCHVGNIEGYTDTYGRMRWDYPSPALTGRCHSISNGRYGHPVQDRAISLREAAALQSFPDGYEFFGPNRRVAMQIGNAVPVRLAEELGKHLLFLSREKPRRPLGRERGTANPRGAANAENGEGFDCHFPGCVGRAQDAGDIRKQDRGGGK